MPRSIFIPLFFVVMVQSVVCTFQPQFALGVAGSYYANYNLFQYDQTSVPSFVNFYNIHGGLPSLGFDSSNCKVCVTKSSSHIWPFILFDFKLFLIVVKFGQDWSTEEGLAYFWNHL